MEPSCSRKWPKSMISGAVMLKACSWPWAELTMVLSKRQVSCRIMPKTQPAYDEAADMALGDILLQLTCRGTDRDDAAKVRGHK